MHIGGCCFSNFWTELFNRYERGSWLSGVIYIHRISDNRFGGIAGRNFDMFRKLCGNTALKNVVLVTNMWGEVSADIGEAREKELSAKFFKQALYYGAQIARHNNSAQSSHDIIRKIAGNHPVALRIQWELVDDKRDILNTTAGEAVNRELNEQIRRHQAELEEIREEMEEALKEKDEEAKRELEEERRRLQERIKEIAKDSVGMASGYAAEKERVEARVKGMEREAKGERERAEDERTRQSADRTRRPQDETDASVAYQVRSKQVRSQTLLDGPSDEDRVTIPIYVYQ